MDAYKPMKPYYNGTVLETIRKSRGFTRSVSILVAIVIIGIMAERTIYYTLRNAEIIEEENVVERAERLAPHKLNQIKRLAAAAAKTQPTVEAAQEVGLSQAVQATQQVIDKLETALNRGELASHEWDNLSDLHQQLITFDQQAMDDFAVIKEQLQQRQIPQIILQRHEVTVASYRQEITALLQKITALEAATHDGVRLDLVGQIKDQLAAKQHKRSHQPFDPNHLPTKSLQPDPENRPRLKGDDFADAGLFNTPFVQLAALGDFKFDLLAGASNPAYLAETLEAPQSDAIKAQAEVLQYDPVKIYHWVRNNIDWQPSWGAIQDADLTLSAKRGNAMDITSLTIALLRASQIPARYVHGTIDVPAENFKNWAGGFDNIEAAGDYVASGGIPSLAMVEGGYIKKIRMEHIWVEAAIDYHPSRGAINRTADSWVALDPSYKQYEYLPGLDVIEISGLDAEQLTQDFTNSGTINEAEGWATGFDPAILQNVQNQAQQALEEHIQNNLTDPTVGDIIGGRKTIIQKFPALPSGLPNPIVTSGARYDKLPSQLQQKITFSLGKNLIGQAKNSITFPWPQLNNQKVTLSFKPATEADELTLQSLLPEGDITDISQLPSSIPAYLINVIPELKVNGEVVKSGDILRLGTELDLVTKVRFVGHGSPPARSYTVIAGSYLSVNVIAGNVSPQKLEALQTKLEQTKTTLESNDQTQLAALTQEELLGDLFHVGTLGYYAQLISLSQIAGLAQGAHQYIAAGTGTIGYEPRVSYFFGIPRAIQTGGVTFDIPYTSVSAVNDGDPEKRRQHLIQTGLLASALEHATPEQMFASQDPNDPKPDAISAVKALQKASLAGQRIYRITQANMSDVLPNIHHSGDTMAEIRASLNAGKEVITHTDAISIPGWRGAGYIILDPVVGDGAYKISGGGNGGWLEWLGGKLSLVMSVLSDMMAEVADSGAEVARALGKLFNITGALFDLVDTYKKCAESGNLAHALIASIVIIVFVSVMALLLTVLSVQNPFATLAIVALLSSVATSALLNTMRRNVCR